MAVTRTLIVDDPADVRFLFRAIVADSGLPIEIVGEADGVDGRVGGSLAGEAGADDQDVVGRHFQARGV